MNVMNERNERNQTRQLRRQHAGNRRRALSQRLFQFRLTLSSRFIARGQGWGGDVEVGRHTHVVPLLLDERMSAAAQKLARC